jgi:hypothetical protein
MKTLLLSLSVFLGLGAGADEYFVKATAKATTAGMVPVSNGTNYTLVSTNSLGGGGGAVSSVAGRTGAVTLTNTDISGLGALATLAGAPAGTLTGTTLAANVTASSLTSAGGGTFGTAAFTAAGAYDAAGSAAAAQAASQPLDADLTSIAALTTTSFGRGLLDDADAAAGRTSLGLGTLATQNGTFSGTSSGTNTGDQDLSSYATTSAVAAGYQPLDADLTAIAALTTTSFGRGLLDDADAAAGRTSLGLGTLATQSGTFSGTSSGTNTGDQDLSSYATTSAVAAGYQPLDADLTTWAGVTPGTGVATALATPSSANVAAAITDEVGTGPAVFKAFVQPTTETLTYSSTTVTVTAGKGPNHSSYLAVTNAFTLAWSGLTDNDGGVIVCYPAATNCTVTLPVGTLSTTGGTATIFGGTGSTNYTLLAWSVKAVGGTNLVFLNAPATPGYYR